MGSDKMRTAGLGGSSPADENLSYKLWGMGWAEIHSRVLYLPLWTESRLLIWLDGGSYMDQCMWVLHTVYCRICRTEAQDQSQPRRREARGRPVLRRWHVVGPMTTGDRFSSICVCVTSHGAGVQLCPIQL